MIPGFYEGFSGGEMIGMGREMAGNTKVIAKKCMKKDLTSSVLVDNARSYFSNF